MSPPQEFPQRTVGLRDFLRGGYHEIHEPVLITFHRRPVAVWTPVPLKETLTKRKTNGEL